MSTLPSLPEEAFIEALDRRLARLIAFAHRSWTAPEERRRARTFGFRPAVEAGVLKREWQGATVRVWAEGLLVRHAEAGTLRYSAATGALTHDDAPRRPSPDALRLVGDLLALIGAYERWVEVREGREDRIARGRVAGSSAPPLNALAEVRSLQRLLRAERAGS